MINYICNRLKKMFFYNIGNYRRGAGVVTEQIANLSTGNRRQGSSPCLSAFLFSGCSVARSSRLVWDQEVAGSNPATPTIFKTFSLHGLIAQLDRATAF